MHASIAKWLAIETGAFRRRERVSIDPARLQSKSSSYLALRTAFS